MIKLLSTIIKYKKTSINGIDTVYKTLRGKW